MTETLVTLTSQNYKGHTIQLNTESFRKERFVFFPTEQGIDHDVDSDGVDFLYVGNCKWADSIEDAKDQINDKIMENSPYYTVEMNGRNYTWKWLSDAVGFASKFNGELSMRFTNP